MDPLARAVTGAAKPALITTENFFVECGGVDGLVKAKKTEIVGDRGGVRIGGVADCAPRTGGLEGSFQRAPAAPTDDDLAVGRRRIRETGSCGRRGYTKEQYENHQECNAKAR